MRKGDRIRVVSGTTKAPIGAEGSIDTVHVMGPGTYTVRLDNGRRVNLYEHEMKVARGCFSAGDLRELGFEIPECVPDDAEGIWMGVYNASEDEHQAYYSIGVGFGWRPA
jgi:hypothetical protein